MHRLNLISHFLEAISLRHRRHAHKTASTPTTIKSPPLFYWCACDAWPRHHSHMQTAAIALVWVNECWCMRAFSSFSYSSRPHTHRHRGNEYTRCCRRCLRMLVGSRQRFSWQQTALTNTHVFDRSPSLLKTMLIYTSTKRLVDGWMDRAHIVCLAEQLGLLNREMNAYKLHMESCPGWRAASCGSAHPILSVKLFLEWPWNVSSASVYLWPNSGI